MIYIFYYPQNKKVFLKFESLKEEKFLICKDILTLQKDNWSTAKGENTGVYKTSYLLSFIFV